MTDPNAFDPSAPADLSEIAQLRAERAALQAQLAEQSAAPAAEPQITEVTITPTHQRGPLAINYGAGRYLLPGRIPTEVLTALDSVPRPRSNQKAEKAEYQSATGLAATAAFLEHVCPDDLKAVLGLEDVPAVFEAWSRHTGLGKA